MWDYSEKVMDHYRNPRNVGKIEDADAIGNAGSLTCGDQLKIYLKIKNGIVTDAKFQTFGCGSAVASSSILTEMIIGKSVEDVRKITNKDIADELGGLPPEKMHCSVMGYEALEDALKGYIDKDNLNQALDEVNNNNKMNEKIVCTCFGITENIIWDAIKQNGLKTVEEITNYTKAGGACGKCKSTIQDIIVEIVPELMIRRVRGGEKELRMVLRDARSNSVVHSRNVLALLDGVPVTDITHLLDFDAMLLSDLQLYPYTYSLGGAVFEGIVDFITTTGDISSLAFDPNVRIVDFDGVSYPVAYTCKDFEPEGDDIRQLLYWHPLVVASEGETVSIPFRLPAYEGRFRAVVEGFSASGKPLYGEIEF